MAQTVKHLPTMQETWVQPTLVLLPGKSNGRRILVGYSPWGRKESDMTEQVHCTLDLFAFMLQFVVLHSSLPGISSK